MVKQALVLLILFSLIPVSYGEGVYFEMFNYPNVEEPILLLVVDSQDDFPDGCREPKLITVGCAISGSINDVPTYILMLDINHMDKIDPYGNTSLWHELKHILCKCDWHGGANT